MVLIPGGLSCTMTCSEMRCPDNSHTLYAGASSLADCICDPGFWRNGSCQACSPGYICSSDTYVPCPAGYWCNGTAVFDCFQGYRCPSGSVDGFGRTSFNSSIACSSGWFLGASNSCLRCPANTTGAPYGCNCGANSLWWNGARCVACEPGWVCGADWAMPCPAGMMCNGTGVANCTRNHTCVGGLDVGCSAGFGGPNCTACADGLSKDSVGYGDCVGSSLAVGVVVGVGVGGLVVLLCVILGIKKYCVKPVLVAMGYGSYASLSTIEIPIDHIKLF